MTTPHRTLQMALDALDAITDDVDGTGLNTMPSFDKAIDAIAALREALAQPAPEPMARDEYDRVTRAWHASIESYNNTHHWMCHFWDALEVIAAMPIPEQDNMVAANMRRVAITAIKSRPQQLGAAPPAAPAPGEPVALESVHLTRDIKGMCTVRVNGRVAIQDNGDIIDHMATLEWFAQPAPVPLTEGRITAIANELAFGGGHCNVYELARAIEAAHGITGGKP